MIIKCEKCQTKFRLDDSKVTDRGVKVRCTKCKEVFTVHKEDQEDLLTPVNQETESPDNGSFSIPSANNSQPAREEQIAFTDTPEQTSPYIDKPLFEDSSPTAASDFDTSAFDGSAISFESDEGAGSNTFNVAENSNEPVAGEVDFSGFDFGESRTELDSTPQSSLSLDDFIGTSPTTVTETVTKDIPQGLDFSDDDMFGAVVESVPAENSEDTITFDFEGDSFAESMDVGGQDSDSKSDSIYSLDSPGDMPFNLGEIDFGEELTSVAVQQVNPDDLKPSQEILFAPIAEAQVKAKSLVGEPEKIVVDEMQQEELPPLSISSRRKKSSSFVVLIGVVVLLALATASYFGFTSRSTIEKAAVSESGKIGVRGVTAAYIENEQVGELLVVSGEAINEYQKPRAALQVKVTVLDASGKVVATKNAYSGNPLTEEQLEEMSLDKIEAAMANQFGDSLANMEVAPGKTIPFIVVLSNLPENAKDFSVESAGSTVAAAKQ
ncbi:MAG: DUF3426 domain-containing protein [Desulfuromonadaceae bacterium]|nr:DUF3426 domain-containing protein [Desulfuromonadaceae bacterium]MDD2853914.1 DUF3426 domain-containing protein [Desulfuromonadaceae bacterium]